MSEPDAVFYFDLASPLAYLAAERILHTMPIATEWQPVLARTLKSTPSGAHPEGHTQRAHGRQAGELLADQRSHRSLIGAESFEAFRCRDDEDIFRLELERRAAELGLQELRWPEPFPFDSAFAMRAATYAKSIGRIVPFAQAAFRQAFAGGRPLDAADNVLIAAAACEMHPSAVLKAAELHSVGRQLAGATATAAQLGIVDVPAVRVGERVFHGERSLEEAAAHAHTAGRPEQARVAPDAAAVTDGIAAGARARRTR